MHRYSECNIGAYIYEGKDAKKRFILDFCEKLQSTKKTLGTYNRKIREHFFIESEFWRFEILVRKDKFIVLDCLANIQKPSGKRRDVKFFCHYDGQERLDNELENITELREFLKREVLKEDTA